MFRRKAARRTVTLPPGVVYHAHDGDGFPLCGSFGRPAYVSLNRPTCETCILLKFHNDGMIKNKLVGE